MHGGCYHNHFIIDVLDAFRILGVFGRKVLLGLTAGFAAQGNNVSV